MCSHLINKETQKYLTDINLNQNAVNLPDLVGWSGDIIPRFQLDTDAKLSPVAPKAAIALKTVDKYAKLNDESLILIVRSFK